MGKQGAEKFAKIADTMATGTANEKVASESVLRFVQQRRFGPDGCADDGDWRSQIPGVHHAGSLLFRRDRWMASIPSAWRRSMSA